jgi:hypothetical protein
MHDAVCFRGELADAVTSKNHLIAVATTSSHNRQGQSSVLFFCNTNDGITVHCTTFTAPRRLRGLSSIHTPSAKVDRNEQFKCEPRNTFMCQGIR